MGGVGSGMHRTTPPRLCETHIAIDVRALARQGWLRPGREWAKRWDVGGRTVALVRGHAEEGHLAVVSWSEFPGGRSDMRKLRIAIVYTLLNFGGYRVWFSCPNCHRRCEKLYHRGDFRCRVCHGLVYRSQRENAMTRHLRKASKIRIRLGGDSDSWSPFPQRPQGMHQTRYERLRQKGMEADAKARAANEAWLDRTARWIGRLAGNQAWTDGRSAVGANLAIVPDRPFGPHPTPGRSRPASDPADAVRRSGAALPAGCVVD